jgi:hypothetical protein
VQGDTAPRQVGPPPRVVLLLPVGLSPGRAVALRRAVARGVPVGALPRRVRPTLSISRPSRANPQPEGCRLSAVALGLAAAQHRSLPDLPERHLAGQQIEEAATRC